jgi:sulfur relay protein TusC/DsrF
MEKVLVLIRTSPYGTVMNMEGFRVCIGLAACEMAVEAVLMDDGIYAVLKGQRPRKIGIASAEKAYSKIKSDFDVPLYVHEESLTKRGITGDDIIQAEKIDTAGIRQKIAEAKTVLTF